MPNDDRVLFRIAARDKEDMAKWAIDEGQTLSQFIRDAVKSHIALLKWRRSQAGLGELFEYVKETGNAAALRDGADVRPGEVSRGAR